MSDHENSQASTPWTGSKIRRLARKKAAAAQAKENTVDTDIQNARGEASKAARTRSTESKSKLGYWNQFEESFGDRVVVAHPSKTGLDGEEILRLCNTMQLEICDQIALQDREPNPSTFLGSGQLNSVRKQLQRHEASALVIDAQLKPSQVKNLEKALKVSVIDRHGLILAIFHANAQTKQAKMQVELAQMKYLLPRLTGVWMGLSRQRGAKGGLGGRGLGESRLELDRRVVKKRISFLSKKLKSLEKSFKTQSSRRSHLPRVALVGYTNAGKSTLMNKLTRAPVYIEDKLFATLDTTVRMLNPPTEPQILISDTVGFVKSLPHDLVASFRSTLSEATSSSLLLHVVDASAPDWLKHMETTDAVLEEIGAEGIDKILVLNKCDQLRFSDKICESQARRATKDREEYIGIVSVSAFSQSDTDLLKHLIIQELNADIPSWRKTHE